MKRAKNRQRQFKFVGWGGERRGAGRKLVEGRRRSVGHRMRSHASAKPSIVTLRLRDDVPDIRGRTIYLAIEDAIRNGRERSGFRVVHFSAQGNHIHLIVEAVSQLAVSRGMQGLTIRIARAINKAAGRRGKVFADRYHAEPIGSPRQADKMLGDSALVREDARIRIGCAPEASLVIFFGQPLHALQGYCETLRSLAAAARKALPGGCSSTGT